MLLCVKSHTLFISYLQVKIMMIESKIFATPSPLAPPPTTQKAKPLYETIVSTKVINAHTKLTDHVCSLLFHSKQRVNPLKVRH